MSSGIDVNIAVRLEAVATPGGVAVSAKAYREAAKHLSATLVAAGSHRFENIEATDRYLDLGARRLRHPRPGAQEHIEPAGPISNRDRGRAPLCQSQRKQLTNIFPTG